VGGQQVVVGGSESHSTWLWEAVPRGKEAVWQEYYGRNIIQKMRLTFRDTAHSIASEIRGLATRVTCLKLPSHIVIDP
jgi:hypothetical protein